GCAASSAGLAHEYVGVGVAAAVRHRGLQDLALGGVRRRATHLLDEVEGDVEVGSSRDRPAYGRGRAGLRGELEREGVREAHLELVHREAWPNRIGQGDLDPRRLGITQTWIREQRGQF